MRSFPGLTVIVFSVACGPAGSPDGGTPADAGTVPDGGATALDGGADAGALSTMTTCTFNDDCPSTERCECDALTGCLCLRGPRGTGKTGVDSCGDGNDCETSLCVEGPGGAFYCSGPCATEAECAGELPVCADIALVGRICIRANP